MKSIDFTLTLVGGGNAEKYLKNYIKKNDLNNVNLVGWLNSDQLINIYQNHELI